MSKILSKSGSSLADVYDIAGSIAGIEELQSKDVNLVHEMGATIFAERVGGLVVVLTSGDIAQNIAFAESFLFLQNARVLGAQLISDDASRVARAIVSVNSDNASLRSDFPLVAWDAGEPFISADINVENTTAVRDLMIPVAATTLPSLLIGHGTTRNVDTLILRGLSTGFGAGTVEVQALIYMGFPEPSAVSNRGLPLPSW